MSNEREEVYHDVDEGIHMGLRGCPIHDYCREHGLMKILPFFCNIDHTMVQAMHMFLIRPTTCSNGDEVCDYWIVDTEIENLTDYAINEDPSEGNGANMIKEVRNGKSIESSFVFALEDDSPVDVQICNQGEVVLVDKTFSVE